MIKLVFMNRTNENTAEIRCDFKSAEYIVLWYSSHHSGDDYSWAAYGD